MEAQAIVQDKNFQLYMLLSSYNVDIIKKYDKGYMDYEKAIRLQEKVRQWINTLSHRI